MKELDLRNTKIYVNGKSKELQEKLFKMGCIWKDSRNNTVAIYLECPFIYINSKLELFEGNNMNVFCNTERKELQVQDVLDYEIPKKDWKEELKEGNICLRFWDEIGKLGVDCKNIPKKSLFYFDKDQQDLVDEVVFKLQLHLEMLRFAEVRNGDWEPDFENDAINIFGLHINVSNVVEVCCSYITIDGYINQVVFKSEEIAQEALEEFGERIKELYL
ncbi:hypothetical protein SAMN05444369_101317 [Capnocytophaga haemolytica]|uniref:DUF2262 domain-containing protein n=1 Tax=Capnocytophaga haemolytica TaxID=45243 RepID=A0AAX2GX95_9FLAO|nr:hypothetical protein [Capnocytophaga haemolytica]AMD85095.1 hypothetical protein AXF12_05915 [Capnocytophaga haemolytica]SFN68417.1 hypothetical protein SAMN05444369_101317 [Capnocytophaga haemolytica]SNV05071.1 Uncharacterised protein [Capnocytophaga haemolytica]